MIIGIDLLKKLNPTVGFLNKVICHQVKMAINYQHSQSYHCQCNCHVIEERPDSIEIHFRNSQVPDISFIQATPTPPVGEQVDNTIWSPLKELVRFA